MLRVLTVYFRMVPARLRRELSYPRNKTRIFTRRCEVGVMLDEYLTAPAMTMNATRTSDERLRDAAAEIARRRGRCSHICGSTCIGTDLWIGDVRTENSPSNRIQWKP